MSLPKYPAYKDSGAEWLGAIPAHWEVRQSRRLFEQRRDAALADDEQLSATQKYGVIPQKLFMEREDQKVVLALSGLENFKHVEPDEFVISLRSFQGGIERSIYRGCVSPAYTVLRPGPGLVAHFWEYLLKSAPYIAALQTMTDGIRDGKNISYVQFGALEVPRPSKVEQAAIAAFLDRETAKIDALIAEQEKLIALLAEKRQATISHAITRGLDSAAPMKDSGVEWLGQVPAHWEVCKLKRYCRQITDGAHISPETEGGVFPFVSTRDLDGNEIDFDGCLLTSPSTFEYMVKTGCQPTPGDILFSKDGTIGKTVVVRDERAFVVASSLIIVSPIPSVLDSDYLNYLCQSSVVTSQVAGFVKGAGLPRLSIHNLLKVLGTFPPTEEQLDIATHLSTETAKLGVLSAAAEGAIALLAERRAALIAAAVTGQIDVRGLVDAPASPTPEAA